ncbi:hypothetical protein Ancab_027964, partial [Ancistrocladus abbreviatus]
RLMTHNGGQVEGTHGVEFAETRSACTKSSMGRTTFAFDEWCVRTGRSCWLLEKVMLA